jgi:arylformamidase
VICVKERLPILMCRLDVSGMLDCPTMPTTPNAPVALRFSWAAKAVDCPFHRYADGKDLSEVGLERFADLPAVVVRAPYEIQLAVGPGKFQGIEVAGKAVLIHTGWSEHWSTPAHLDDHPFLTQEAAAFLRDQRALLVGIDSHNIDDTRGRNSRPVHTILLRHDILIVEHLTGLEKLPEKEFSFSAIPPKIRGMGTFPVRAFARLT